MKEIIEANMKEPAAEIVDLYRQTYCSKVKSFEKKVYDRIITRVIRIMNVVKQKKTTKKKEKRGRPKNKETLEHIKKLKDLILSKKKKKGISVKKAASKIGVDLYGLRESQETCVY